MAIFNLSKCLGVYVLASVSLLDLEQKLLSVNFCHWHWRKPVARANDIPIDRQYPFILMWDHPMVFHYFTNIN